MRILAALFISVWSTTSQAAVTPISTLFRFSGPVERQESYRQLEKEALHLMADKIADGTIAAFRIMHRKENSLDICASSYELRTDAMRVSFENLEQTLLGIHTDDFTVRLQRKLTQRNCERIYRSIH